MSYYYTYYLGKRETATGRVSLAGPYDEKGHVVSLMSKSRSFASDLHEDMLPLAEEEMAEDVREQFTYEDWKGNKVLDTVKSMPFAALSGKTPFKCAYVPAFDVIDQNDTDDDDEIYYSDKLNDAQYATLCAASVRGSAAGKRTIERYDLEMGEYKGMELGPEDYVRHMWVDTTSREYEEWLLSTIVWSVGDLCWPPKGFENILLEVEG